MNTRAQDNRWLQDFPAAKANGGYLWSKRMMDIIVASVAIFLLGPLLLLTMLAIRIDSRGAVFFSQIRVGKNARQFRCWKFRSMHEDAEARKLELLNRNEMPGGVTFKMTDDPRITRVGRFIRKMSIDELPQLWNVLRGDMTLVGPRPAVPAEVSEYTPYQRRRLSVTPGITCIWQVSGRSTIPFPQQVQMDLDYIARRGFQLDMLLLLRTVPAVLTSRGAC